MYKARAERPSFYKKPKRFISTRYVGAIVILVVTNLFTIITLYSGISGDVENDKSKEYLAQRFEGSNRKLLKLASGEAVNGFVHYRSYRVSSMKFAVVGLSELSLHHKLNADDCRWRGRNGVEIRGRLTVNHPGDAHSKKYEAAIMFCMLRAPTNANFGGRLLLNISNELALVYQEKHKPKNLIKNSTLPYRLAFCSSPIYGQVKAASYFEWIAYHSVIHKVDVFYLYDAGGVRTELRKQLKQFFTEKKIVVTDIVKFTKYETWLYAQLLAINDCAYQTRFLSQWTLFMDFDEYLHVRSPPHSILSILDQHEGKNWVTFGSVFYYTDKCTFPPGSTSAAFSDAPWSVELMVFRQSEVHCRDVPKYGNRSHCLGQDGHRKYIINPRQIDVCGIHRVVYPSRGGVHLSTDDVFLSHFRGINSLDLDSCLDFVGPDETISGNYVRDLTFAKAAKEVREGHRFLPS